MNAIEHVVLFKGRLMTLDYFVDQLILFLENHGIDYYLVDTNKPETFNCPEFDRYLENQNIIMFTFNNIGIKLYTGDENIWKHYGIPVYSFIVDPPRAFSDALIHPECDIRVISLDKNRNDFVKEFYPKVKRTYYFPAAGVDVNSLLQLQDRELDVIYMGSCQPKEQTYPVLDYLEDGGSDLYNTVINYLVENTDITTEDAIRKYLESRFPDIDKEKLFEILILASKSIEDTVRRYFKIQGMYALDQMGVKVDIWGKNWEDDDVPFSDNITVHGWIQPEELLKICGNAKISLVYMGWQKRGCSEKNFDSMLNRAVCVSDTSEYLRQHYTDGKNIVYFDMNNPAQMAYDVKWLLEHLDAAQKIADAGYRTAMLYDSWDVRYKEIFTMICSEKEV